jgi:hypothetical protein
MMKRFVIERKIAGVGAMTDEELGGAAQTSNRALKKIDGIQWQHSYVTADKTFCIYLAESEDQIREHARLSGFPANTISQVGCIIDPTTELNVAQAVKAMAAA